MANTEKRIQRFVYDLEGKFCALDLADAPKAVEISLPDGLVTFREGVGQGRIHGWVLTPDSVQEFEVDRIEGRNGVRLWHSRRGVDVSHFLGFVEDVESATSWVKRVNLLYSERQTEIAHRAENRKTQFRAYPVVNDIIETGLNIVLPDAYQYSATGQLPARKLSPWERAYVERSMELLAKETGAKRDKLKVDVRPFTPHDYSWFSDRVMYDAAHFSGRITQPLELIYDREQRHDKIGVNSFAVAKCFALVYFKKSIVKGALRLKAGIPATETFEDFVRAFRSAADNEHMMLCAPAQQSVYYAFYDAHLGQKFDLLHHFAKKYDIDSMATWLWQNLKHGVVACDVGEVNPLINAVAQHQGQGNQALLEHCLVPYDRAVQIGFCYRADDRM